MRCSKGTLLRAVLKGSERFLIERSGAHGVHCYSTIRLSRGKSFLIRANVSERTRMLRAFSSAPSGPFTPQTPQYIVSSFLVKTCSGLPPYFGVLVSSFLRLAQVFYSDVPYRVSNVFWDFCISFFFHSLRIFNSSRVGIHGSLSFFHRFILTRHFALHVFRLDCPSK